MSALRHQFAEVNGVRLHYASAGKGKLALFLHGFPEFWYAWKGQLEDFGRDFHAVAPDLRGYNLSSKPDGVDQYKLELLIEDVRALIQHLGCLGICGTFPFGGRETYYHQCAASRHFPARAS